MKLIVVRYSYRPFQSETLASTDEPLTLTLTLGSCCGHCTAAGPSERAEVRARGHIDVRGSEAVAESLLLDSQVSNAHGCPENE